jgi:L-ascorbate metabolism protein UlaG (beta-lactamase superfamily)
MTEQAIELTWLGQAGFSIAIGRTRVLVDPFMSEHEARLFPPPSLDALGSDVDWVLITHEHLDHLDLAFLPRLIDRHPGARFVLPAPIADRVDGIIPGEQLTAVQPGDIVQVAAHATVEVVPAYHGFEVGDGYTDGSGSDGQVRFVGYILHTPGLSVYHSGDTIVTESLLAALDGKTIDVALLPINGRDFFREKAGLVGNMSCREAVDLALWAGARTLIPMHWDLFAGNTERPGTVLDEVTSRNAQIHVLTLARLAPVRLS